MLQLIIAIALSLSLAACGSEQSGPAAEEAIPELSVEEVASLIERGEAVPIDANGPETRAENGTLPGARLLSSSRSFDPEAELPADHAATLVFYCANEMCHASDGAAERARQAGYSEVHVMRDGIAGWREAGHPTDTPES